MTATEEVILRVSGDAAGAQAALKQVQAGLQQLSSAVKSSSGDLKSAGNVFTDLSGRLDGLKARLQPVADGAKTLAVAFGALSAAGGALIKSTAQVAMRNEVLALSLYTVGRNAGFSRGELDTLVDGVKALGITTSQARLSLTRMIQGQLDLAQATDLARTAQDLVVISGENSSVTYGALMDAITSLEPRLLRQYGIVATVDQILGDLSDSTDSAAKRQRFLEFVLAEGTRVAGVYEEAMGVVGKRITSIPRLVEEAKAALGKHFLPVIGMVVDLLSQLLKWFERLPEGVQRLIAVAVMLGTAFAAVGAALTGLVAVLPMIISGVSAVAGAVGALAGVSLAPILAALLAVGAAIGALVVAGKLLATAWKEDWGGIRSAVEGAWAKIGPLLKQLQALFEAWGTSILAQVKQIAASLWSLVTTVLEPLFERMAALIGQINWGDMFATLSDALNVAGNLISSWLETLQRLLRGEGLRAFSSLEDAAIDGLTLVAMVFDKYIKDALVWGWNLIVSVANGISQAVQSVLVSVMEYVGNAVAGFLAPGSAPEEGPLSNIIKWGQGVMEEYLRAFELADFSILQDALAPIEDILQSAVLAGDLDEEEFVEVYGAVQEQAAELIALFRETGEISEEVLGEIAETLGEGSEEYVKFLRLQMEHQQALEELAEVQEEVAEAEAAGFVSAELKDRLAAAEDAAEAAQEEMDWQREYLEMQQESIDLQLRLIDVLEDLGEALEGLSGVGDDLEDVGGTGIGEGLIEAMGLDDLDEASKSLSALKAQIGQMSPEFEAMRSKVVAWVDAFRDWLELSLDEKLMGLAQYLGEVTGIDFPGFLQKGIDLMQEIDEKGLLEVIKEWAGKGLDYVEENWKDWAEVIGGFLLDSFEKAVELLKEKIEDSKEKLSDWFGEIIEKFLAWVESKYQEWGQSIHDHIANAMTYFVQLITIDIPMWKSELVSWFSGIITGWISDLGTYISTWAEDLKNWMGSLISDFVSRVRDSASGWLDGLKSVGSEIVNKVKEGLSGAWDMVEYLGGLLSEVASSITAGDWLFSLANVGAAIIDMIKSGILDNWNSFVKWLIDLLQGLRDLLPWSEPKDHRSPLRGLADSGRAMVENFASGIDFASVRAALQTELALAQRALAATDMMGGMTIYQTFEGGMVFPGVRDGRDAAGVRRELARRALEASMMGRTGGI